MSEQWTDALVVSGPVYEVTETKVTGNATAPKVRRYMVTVPAEHETPLILDRPPAGWTVVEVTDD